VRVLFDQGTPLPLRDALVEHDVETAFERGWATLSNGELLRMAEADGFEVLVTTDLNLKHQQNLLGRRIAVVVLTTPSWPRIRKTTALIAEALIGVVPGSYVEVTIP
jgi:predicted nuclease of predicted toxin-antitoxin system